MYVCVFIIYKHIKKVGRLTDSRHNLKHSLTLCMYGTGVGVAKNGTINNNANFTMSHFNF